MADLIPTGRTSLVKRDDVPLQIQTEYAYRPVPRITTTVQKNGQVLQKIERNLDKPISSIEEKNRMEVTIRKQHAEVIAIIERNGSAASIPPPRPVAKSAPSDPKPYPEPGALLTMAERLHNIPGQHRVFRLDNEGNFFDAQVSKEFKKLFKAVFKNLHELISIFATVPGVGLTRESGVYEVEFNSLYLISTGTEFFIMSIENPDHSVDYEHILRKTVDRI